MDNPLKKKLNLKKISMEHYISKKMFNFEISSYTFKVATTKNL